MPTEIYFGDDVTISAQIDGNGVTIGKARSAMVRAEADHVELFTTASVTRDEVKRREVSIIVELEFVQFNEDIAQYWLSGDGTTTSTTLTDDTNVATFQVTIEHLMTDHTGSTGDESLKAVIDNVHFPEMPLINAQEGEYAVKSLTGRGDGVTFTKPQVA